MFSQKNQKFMTLDIHIKQGIGDIKFQMPIDDVIAILGETPEVETIDNAVDETTTVLRYTNGMTFFFEGDNQNLTCIDISNPDITLFGKKIFDLSEKEIVNLMVENKYFEQDVDNEDWGERRVTFNEANIDFYFEDEELQSVIIGG